MSVMPRALLCHVSLYVCRCCRLLRLMAMPPCRHYFPPPLPAAAAADYSAIISTRQMPPTVHAALMPRALMPPAVYDAGLILLLRQLAEMPATPLRCSMSFATAATTPPFFAAAFIARDSFRHFAMEAIGMNGCR